MNLTRKVIAQHNKDCPRKREPSRTSAAPPAGGTSPRGCLAGHAPSGEVPPETRRFPRATPARPCMSHSRERGTFLKLIFGRTGFLGGVPRFPSNYQVPGASITPRTDLGDRKIGVEDDDYRLLLVLLGKCTACRTHPSLSRRIGQLLQVSTEAGTVQTQRSGPSAAQPYRSPTMVAASDRKTR